MPRTGSATTSHICHREDDDINKVAHGLPAWRCVLEKEGVEDEAAGDDIVPLSQVAAAIGIRAVPVSQGGSWPQGGSGSQAEIYKTCRGFQPNCSPARCHSVPCCGCQIQNNNPRSCKWPTVSSAVRESEWVVSQIIPSLQSSASARLIKLCLYK
jgi:hypothetical protein